MSGHALNWAKSLIAQHPELTPTERFVLYALAEHANRDTGQAWPGETCLMAETGLSRATLYRALGRLHELVPAKVRSGRPTLWLFPGENPSHGETGDIHTRLTVTPVPSDEIVHTRLTERPTRLTVRPDPSHGETRTKKNRVVEPATVPAAISEHPAMRAQREADMLNQNDGAEDIAWFGNDAELRKIKPKPREPRGSRLDRAMSQIGTG